MDNQELTIQRLQKKFEEFWKDFRANLDRLGLAQSRANKETFAQKLEEEYDPDILLIAYDRYLASEGFEAVALQIPVSNAAGEQHYLQIGETHWHRTRRSKDLD